LIYLHVGDSDFEIAKRALDRRAAGAIKRRRV
jgi:hypothetical protein